MVCSKAYSRQSSRASAGTVKPIAPNERQSAQPVAKAQRPRVALAKA